MTRSPACFLGTALALVAGAVAFGDAAFGADSPVARWRGGELGQERFAAVYDPDGEARSRGGNDLRVALAKAVYLEILAAAAREAGLDRDPRFLARLEETQQQRLRRADAMLDLPAVPDTEVAREAESLPRRLEVDLDLVLLRCSLAPAQREQCLAALPRLEHALATTPDLTTLASDEVLAGAFNGLDPAALDPFLGPVLVAAELGSIVTAELISGPAVVRLRARRELLDLARARTQLLERRRGAAIEALRTADPRHVELSNDAVLLEVFPSLRVALLPDRSGPAEWALADFAFEVLPGFASEPTAADRDAARAELTKYHLDVWQLSGSAALRQAGALTLAMSEAGAKPLAELVRTIAPDAEHVATEIRARDLARLPGALRNTSGIWGPSAIDPRVAQILSVPCVGSCLVVGVTGPPQFPEEAALLERARRSVRARMGGGFDAWMELFGRRFEVELLLALDPLEVPFDQPQRSNPTP